MQPKAHYSLHLPSFLARDGQLTSCWVHERKHRQLKRHGNHSTNANRKVSWERGILEEVVLAQLLETNEWDCKSGVVLHNPLKASAELTMELQRNLGHTLDSSFEVFVSFDALCNYENVSRGDCAQTSAHMVEIWFHLQVVSEVSGASFHSVVSKWKPAGPNQFRMTEAPELVPTESLQRAIPFYVGGDVATVIP